MEQTEEQQEVIKFEPVKDYALLRNITVQAVYDRIKKHKVHVKKIGSYTLVADK